MKTYEVKKSDLKGALKDFPIEVVQKMVDYQVEQGYEPNVEVFQKMRLAGGAEHGFDWDKTPEGYNFWYNVLDEYDFERFFEKYPKPGTPVYKVTEDDLKGELEGFPIEIVQKMVDRQIEQGYKPSVEVFQKFRFAGKARGGFVWEKTPEGPRFWWNVISYKDFDKFFKKYPKK